MVTQTARHLIRLSADSHRAKKARSCLCRCLLVPVVGFLHAATRRIICGDLDMSGEEIRSRVIRLDLADRLRVQVYLYVDLAHVTTSLARHISYTIGPPVSLDTTPLTLRRRLRNASGEHER